MSEKVGPVAFGEKEELVFLGRDFGSERNYSENTASLVDGEISKLMKSAFRRAADLLKKHRAVLDAIAARLMEKESIERDEFAKLIAGFGLIPKGVEVPAAPSVA